MVATAAEAEVELVVATAAAEEVVLVAVAAAEAEVEPVAMAAAAEEVELPEWELPPRWTGSCRRRRSRASTHGCRTRCGSHAALT